MPMTTHIRMSLDASNHRDAHRLYDAALTLAALACMFDPAALRAVSDKLEDDARGTDAHERAVLLAMSDFLAKEAAADWHHTREG